MRLVVSSRLLLCPFQLKMVYLSTSKRIQKYKNAENHLETHLAILAIPPLLKHAFTIHTRRETFPSRGSRTIPAPTTPLPVYFSMFSSPRTPISKQRKPRSSSIVSRTTLTPLCHRRQGISCSRQACQFWREERRGFNV